MFIELIDITTDIIKLNTQNENKNYFNFFIILKIDLGGRNGLTREILRSRKYSYIFCLGRPIIVMKYCAKLLDITIFYFNTPFYMVYTKLLTKLNLVPIA